MARQRRGGFRPEIKGTLGTLLRTTLAQASVVRDAIERGAREGRSRLDEARAHRRRNDTLAELGEIVLELIRRGEIDLDEIPEARGLVHELDDLDAHDREDSEDVPRAPVRRRFDDRTPSKPTRDLKARRDDTKPTRELKARRDAAPAADRDDGTVSSARWSPPRGGKATRVWRPVVDDSPTTPEAPASHERTRDLKPRKGGISFEDEDLADYMHPDDVPPKPSSEGDS